jgi:hypothetical protein
MPVPQSTERLLPWTPEGLQVALARMRGENRKGPLPKQQGLALPEQLNHSQVAEFSISKKPSM